MVHRLQQWRVKMEDLEVVWKQLKASADDSMIPAAEVSIKC